MLGSVIIRTSRNTTISMLCHFSSVFCEENFPRCRHFKCLACPPKRSQKTLRVKFVPRFPIVSGVGNCFIIRSPSLFFKEYLWEARRCRHFHTRAITRRRKAWFHLRMSMRIVFAAKNSWTTLRMSTPLFVGSYLQVTWWALGQWKGRNICMEW